MAPASSQRWIRAAAARPRHSSSTASPRTPTRATSRCSTWYTRCAPASSPARAFDGDRIMGAILFEMTMDREIEGRPSRRLPLERQERRAVPQDRQGSGRGEGRRADHEADAGPGRPARPRGRQRRLRHQGTLCHQAARRRPGRGRGSAVRGRPAGSREGSRADHRARGRHQQPAARPRPRTNSRPPSSRV